MEVKKSATMAGEQLSAEDEQPPMCGGVVFNKFRPKQREKKEKSLRRGYRSFDQRPISSDTRSATSSDNSFDEEPFDGPGTVLLNDSNHFRRGKRFTVFRNFMGTISEETPHIYNESLGGEFLMGELTKRPSIEESKAVEFDPSDVNKLRSQHIKAMSSKNLTPMPSTSTKSSFRSTSSWSPMNVTKEVTTKDFGFGMVEDPNDQKLGSLRSMKEVVAQQQETMKIMSSQNRYYRRKLGAAQNSFQKLYKNQVSQADLIGKLQLEKDSFEAETLLLREEMASVRKQLELFQKQFTQQTQQNNKGTEPARQMDETTKTPSPTHATLAPANTPRKANDHQAPGVTQPCDSKKADTNIKTQEEDIEKAESGSDPAQNYWKREWELSIQGMGELEVSNNENTSAETDENTNEQPNDISCESSKSTESSIVHSIRGVDPPEEKKPAGIPKAHPKPADYEKDIKFVHKLLQKYQKGDTSETSHQLQHPSNNENVRIGREFDETQVAAEEQETLIEIENMFEVERVYQERQAGMARTRAAFENEEYDDTLNPGEKQANTSSLKTHQESLHANANAAEHNKSNKSGVEDQQASRPQRSRAQFKRSFKEGNHMEPLYENEPVERDVTSNQQLLRGPRLQDPIAPEYSQRSDYSSVNESRQDDTSKSERTDYGPIRETLARSEVSRHGPTREQSTRNERSGYDLRQEASQHSEATEYADYIEHSTSRHNAFLWNHSGRSERSSHLPKGEVSERSEKKGFDSKQDYSYRSHARDSVMAEEFERSEHTLVEVREPGQHGRRGGTYKIKMSSGRPRNHRHKLEQEPPRDVRGREPSDRTQRSIFSRHTGEYNTHSRRLL